LITFQFDRHGGGFIIEIGQCSPDGYTTYWGKQIAAAKVTAWDLSPKERARVQPRSGSGTDAWFRFDDSEFSRTAEAVKGWQSNALRHSFASYHLAHFKDAAKLALELGHTKQDLLFRHYRELVKPDQAAKYWNIRPATQTNLVAISA
jgi:integrase